MRHASLVLVLLIALTGTAWGQRVKGSTLSGVIKSSAVTAPGSTTVVMLVTPPIEEGVFILTQACIPTDTNDMEVTSTAFGELTTVAGLCTTFAPGFAIPPGDTISCKNNVGSPHNCSITGVLVPK